MAETRDRILTATAELFRRQGLRATSLRQIAEAAGVPNGSVYHFFPGGKEELAVAVIETTGRAYGQLFEVIAGAAPDAEAAVTDFFEGAATVLEETDFLDICPIGTIAGEVASTSDELRQATSRVLTGWVEAVVARMEAFGVPASEREDLALALIAALEGGFMLTRAARDADQLRAIGRQVRRLVAASLAAATPAKRGRRT